MRPTHSVDAVKEKSKRGVKVGKNFACKHQRKRTGISTYRRVAAVFRRRISTGEWQAGDRLPALDALVKELHVGRITVRHALDLLAEEGLIARHRDRRGSSVICQPLDRRWFTLALNRNKLEAHSAAITVSEIHSGPWTRPLPPISRLCADCGCRSPRPLRSCDVSPATVAAPSFTLAFYSFLVISFGWISKSI